jgi:hypothetical protein
VPSIILSLPVGGIKPASLKASLFQYAIEIPRCLITDTVMKETKGMRKRPPDKGKKQIGSNKNTWRIDFRNF